MTSNDDPESTAEEREKEAPGFEMTNMPLHLQLYHSFLQVHIELTLCKFYISDIYMYGSSDILFLFLLVSTICNQRLLHKNSIKVHFITLSL